MSSIHENKSADGHPVDIKNAKILIVDDTPANIDILWKTLESEGYNISGAPNGTIALELVPRTMPNLILLDVMMHDIDGYEVCRQLKSNPLTEHIPIIFITAKTEPSDIVQGFKMGGDDYITKPFYQEEVKSRITTHLRLRTLLNERTQLIEELTTKNQLLVENEEKLKKMAYSDPLTGLRNRLSFNQHIEQHIAENNHFVLFYIDLDKFKQINDTYGHHIGDEVLKTIAFRLQDCCQKDYLVTRLGGDEFAIIVHRQLTQDELEYIVEQLLLEIKQTIAIDNLDLTVDASIGVICYPDDTQSPQLLLQYADASMYCAKRSDDTHYCTYQQIKSKLT